MTPALEIPLLDRTRGYLAGGWSMLPVRADGTKAPAGWLLPTEWSERENRQVASWNEFQSRPPTADELVTWFARPQRPVGFGLIGGYVSGGAECIDFDLAELFEPWRQLVLADDPKLLDRVAQVETPLGFHAWLRSETPGTNRKLAERSDAEMQAAKQAGQTVKRTLIETRGDGGYALAPGCPAACHETGRLYRQIAGPPLESLPKIGREQRELLMLAAMSFNRRGMPAPAPKSSPLPTGNDLRPGDDFDRNGWDFAEILEPAGWVRATSDRWRRPGKSKGWSATVGVVKGAHGEPLLHVFSGNAHPFEPGNYGRFRALTLVRFNGDHSACARDLAGRGFGQQKPTIQKPKPAPPKVLLSPGVTATTGVVLAARMEDADAIADVFGDRVDAQPLPDGRTADIDLTALAGRTVWLWPPASPVDPRTGLRPGVERFRDVAELLGQLAPRASVRWIEPDDLGLPAGAGAAEFLAGFAAGERADAADKVFGNAVQLGAVAEFDRLSADIAAGRYRQVEWPWQYLTRLTQALLPGAVTVLCGPPGDGKSFLTLQAVLHWLGAGIDTRLWELEEDGAFWVRRALAILEGRSDFTRIEWEAENPAEMRDARFRWADQIAALDAAMTLAPRRPPTPRQVVDWLRRHAAQGARVLVVDPVTAVSPCDMQHLQDFSLMMDAKLIAREYRCSILFVSHPKANSGKMAPLDRMAGGTAYQRFAQNVLIMHRHDPDKEGTVLNKFGGREWMSFGRSLLIAKARNAAGGGKMLAFQMAGGTLRFEELGPVLGSKREDADV